MKKSLSLIGFIILLSFSPSLTSKAQVTIGVTEAPASGALLQLKEISNMSNGEANATKGLLLPRVKLTKRDQLYPMFSSDLNYIPNKSNIDLQHAGLLVMNIEENIDENLCFGINIWDGAKWNCLRANANYTIDCNTVEVKGIYKKNQNLISTTHYIELDLIAENNAVNAIYHVKTNTIDGIYFEGKGKLVAGRQTIVLQGYGTPTRAGEKILTISTNSESNSTTCKALINIALTPKKILSLGTYSDIYGYCFAGSPGMGVGHAQSAKLVKTATNFGLLENSTVKIESVVVNNNVLGDYKPTSAELKTALDEMPDVVILGVYYVPDADACQHLAAYLIKGGVLLAFLEFDGAELINKIIFGNNSITSTTINNGGAVYALPYNNDEILNGPFGDIRGKQWGEDSTPTRAFSNIPSESIIAYSTGDDMTQSTSANTDKLTMFRHTSYNYLYCGDGGFNSGFSDFAYKFAYPFRVDESNNNKPIARTVYGRGTTFDVYNSVLTANAIAWGLKKAQEREDKSILP